MAIEITGKENPEYKELIKISKGKTNYIFVEGWKLFQELVNSPLKIEKVYIDKKNETLISNLKCKKVFIANPLLAQAFTTESKPEKDELIISIVKQPSWELNELFKTKKNLIFLEQVQDPGNLGTILRSSLAFNAGGIILTEDSANPYNTKVVRASAGAVFNIPVTKLTASLEKFKLLAKKAGCKIIATSRDAKKSITAVEGSNSQKVFLFGNEGSGLSKELLNMASETISIPHSNKVESLNLATAVSIILWEAS